ncbi:MAG: hypothetical protein JO246_08720 [Frankiaceae bacterium]|nr:hypothetical protein [Frankiaceae bacterium]
MLDDAVNAKRSEGGAEGVKVIDIAQVLADSIGLRKIPAMAGAPAAAEGEQVEAHQPDATTGTSAVQPAGEPSAEETEAAAGEAAREPVTDPTPEPGTVSEATTMEQTIGDKPGTAHSDSDDEE